jgi:hypothetical protein
MKRVAISIETTERRTAGRAAGLNWGRLKTVAEEDTMIPPADNPTKNMKAVM